MKASFSEPAAQFNHILSIIPLFHPEFESRNTVPGFWRIWWSCLGVTIDKTLLVRGRLTYRGGSKLALGFLESLSISLISGALAGYAAYQVQSEKLRKEYKLHDRAEDVAKELLNYKQFKTRSFKLIRHHLGGFEDNELRKILVRAGAIRFMSKSGEELWGLIEKNRDIMSLPRLDGDPVPPKGLDDDLFDLRDNEKIRKKEGL